MLSDGYSAELREIIEQIPKLQAEIEELKAAVRNVEKFLNIAYKNTDLQELTPEVLRTFITKVVIHERESKWSKTAEQKVDIYFRHIGNVTMQSAEQQDKRKGRTAETVRPTSEMPPYAELSL